MHFVPNRQVGAHLKLVIFFCVKFCLNLKSRQHGVKFAQ